MLNYLVYWL